MKVEIISDDLYELLISRKNDNHFHVSLKDLENNEILFDHKCDTFVTGNLILHLKKAYQSHKDTSHKIITSRWYPKVSSIFHTSTVKYPYIYIIIDRINNVETITFKVTVDHYSTFTFITKANEIKEILNTEDKW